MKITPITRQNTVEMIAATLLAFTAPLLSPFPKRCAAYTALPAPYPHTMEDMKVRSGEVLPIAARELSPANLLTITESTRLWVCANIAENMSGMLNVMKFLSVFPS